MFARRVSGNWTYYEGGAAWIPWTFGEPHLDYDVAGINYNASVYGMNFSSNWHHTILCETSAAGMYMTPHPNIIVPCVL